MAKKLQVNRPEEEDRFRNAQREARDGHSPSRLAARRRTAVLEASHRARTSDDFEDEL